MQLSSIAKPSSGPRISARGIQTVIRRRLTSRLGLTIAGLVVVAAGLALGWNWLSAIGVAPIILSLAPCAAMCALGACAMGRGNKSSCSNSGSADVTKPNESEFEDSR